MRVLLDSECAAVAGGHESECVQNVKAAAIVIGAGTGAIVGTAAGGMGAVPGAIVGASAGALVAEVVARPLCAMEEKEKSDGEESDSGGGSGGVVVQGTVGITDDYAPLPAYQLVVVTDND